MELALIVSLLNHRLEEELRQCWCVWLEELKDLQTEERKETDRERYRSNVLRGQAEDVSVAL